VNLRTDVGALVEVGIVNVDLFRVEGFERKNGKLALLPGVPQEVIRKHRIGNVRQGDAIELCFTDGTSERTMIADYYVRVPMMPDEAFDVAELPIIICLPADFMVERVTEGTQVRLLS
jgi:hypothetical protein